MSTHGSGSLQASASNTASSTTTSSTLDGNVAFMGEQGVTAKITNGGTGPTVGCTATCNVSDDNSTWKFFSAQTAGTTLSVVYTFVFEPPRWARYAQIVFSGNTGQTVTIEAQYQQLLTAT